MHAYRSNRKLTFILEASKLIVQRVFMRNKHYLNNRH
jgi:hypothetical protein